FIGAIIDSLGRAGTQFEDVLRLALLIVGFAALEASLRAGARYLMLDASRKAEYRMRNDLFAHLQRMHLAYFQHQRIGDLMARMTNDLTWVRQMMGPGIMQGSFTIMVFAFAVLSMLSVSVKLTILAMILMPLASITFWYIGRTVHVRFERLQSQFGDMSTKAQENFSGIRVVKAFSQESAETDDFARVNREYFRRAVSLTGMQGLIWPSISFIMGVAVLSVLYVGGQDAIRGELSIGSLAIVGPTGSGKTTLVNLIPRLFDVQQGEVLLDGISVERRPLEQLRRAVGYVPQETFLFSVPLRENVGLGLDDRLTDSQLDWAGDVSQLNKDVEDFPARYDTMIGERGVTLSGGQKQRTAIARAVAKDPRVLILDDALSAVDTYTEAEILRRLRGVMRERTSIVVAHR